MELTVSRARNLDVSFMRVFRKGMPSHDIPRTEWDGFTRVGFRSCHDHDSPTALLACKYTPEAWDPGIAINAGNFIIRNDVVGRSLESNRDTTDAESQKKIITFRMTGPLWQANNPRAPQTASDSR